MPRRPVPNVGRGLFIRMATLPIVAFLLALSVSVLGAAHARGAENFGQPEVGRYIYDQSGLLTAAEVRDLETRAAAVVRAGAPTIVYIRSQDADEDATLADAQELMDAWNVQSASGARDGVVVFLNLDPDNQRRGQAAIWAGKRQAQGNLPESELRRIYDRVMKPLLSDDQTAAGIGAGLDNLANSLTVGPPPPPQPSAMQRVASTVAGLPLAIVAILLTGAMALLGGRIWSARPTAPANGAPTTQRPGDLPPAVAGALVGRRIETTALTEATLLDFARRGGITLEPQGQKEIRVRLLDTKVVQHQFERVVWDTLARAADADGTVTAKGLKQLGKSGKPFGAALKAALESRGLYEPTVGDRQRPFYIGGTMALLLAFGAAIVAAIGMQPWGFIGVTLFAIVAVVALCLGWAYPQTTVAGEEAAAPWRAYKAGLQSAAKGRGQALDLDAVLPDAVAFGLVSALDKRLKEASESGYAPSWFVRQSGQGTSMATFYPYWILFHSSTSPSASSSGGSVSSGGAGAGGSF